MKHISYLAFSYISFMLTATCLLGSCGIFTRYSRQPLSIVVDSLYRHAMDDCGDTTSLASLPWRQLFADEPLQRLVDSALARNTDLAIALLQIDEAQATLANARHTYLPTLTLAPQAGISHFDGDTKKTYSIGATAAWEADAFGRITNMKRVSEAALEQRKAYAQAVKTQLVATVAESYYTLLMLDEQLAISRLTFDNWSRTIDMLDALVSAGRANDVAVQQARASRTALEANILSVEKSINETENSICALLKEPAHVITRTTLDVQHFPDELRVGLPVELLANRPDVRYAEAVLAEAFYATNSARSAFYPSFTLSGSSGWTNNGGGAITNPGRWLSQAVASLTAPLFNHGTQVTNLKMAKARQQEALMAFEQALLDAANEVNDALEAWQTAQRRVELDKQQVGELETAAEKTEWLVRYSSANYLEVLSAQQSLLAARLTLAQDRTSVIQSIIRLYHALGGGL